MHLRPSLHGYLWERYRVSVAFLIHYSSQITRTSGNEVNGRPHCLIFESKELRVLPMPGWRALTDLERRGRAC